MIHAKLKCWIDKNDLSCDNKFDLNYVGIE